MGLDDDTVKERKKVKDHFPEKETKKPKDEEKLLIEPRLTTADSAGDDTAKDDEIPTNTRKNIRDKFDERPKRLIGEEKMVIKPHTGVSNADVQEDQMKNETDKKTDDDDETTKERTKVRDYFPDKQRKTPKEDGKIVIDADAAKEDESEPDDTAKTKKKVRDHFDERQEKSKTDEKIVIKPHPGVKLTDVKEDKVEEEDDDNVDDEDKTSKKRDKVKGYFPEKQKRKPKEDEKVVIEPRLTVEPSILVDASKDDVVEDEEVEPYDTTKAREKVRDHFDERPEKSKTEEKIVIKPHPGVERSDGKGDEARTGEEEVDAMKKRSKVQDYFPERQKRKVERDEKLIIEPRATVKPSSEEDVDKDDVSNNDEVEPYDTRKTKLDEKIIIKP